jgi:hypothetical protein
LIRIMFLRFNRRFKDGREHRYWNIVESKRCAGGKVVQRQVLYLGEINNGQRAAWCQLIEAFDEGSRRHRQLALFPADRGVPACADGYGVQVRLDVMELHRPRQWRACFLACQLYEHLELDRLWAARLPDSRKGTRLAAHPTGAGVLPADRSRQRVALAPAVVRAERDGRSAGRRGLMEITALYRCLDKLLEHKTALFDHLRQRWQDLFGASFEVLLYDLTSNYFEYSQPDNEDDKQRYGYTGPTPCSYQGYRVLLYRISSADGPPLNWAERPDWIWFRAADPMP